MECNNCILLFYVLDEHTFPFGFSGTLIVAGETNEQNTILQSCRIGVRYCRRFTPAAQDLWHNDDCVTHIAIKYVMTVQLTGKEQKR